jgi:hypothetical protein
MGADDAWTVVIAGVRAFLDACLEPAVQRIALIEAPAVLGWSEWREIDERYALGLVRMSLETAMEAGEIEQQPLDPLAHVLLGALTEAALLIARADDTEAARRTVGNTVERLISSLRVPQAATK